MMSRSDTEGKIAGVKEDLYLYYPVFLPCCIDLMNEGSIPSIYDRNLFR